MARLNFAIVALALGLAMDAVAVAGAKGMAATRLRARDAFVMALFFGGFQAIMPLVGGLASSRFSGIFSAYGPWIAFVLLASIGIKMLRDVGKGDEEDDAPKADFRLRTMTILAIATSIDALAAGLTLPFLGVPIPLAVATIGLTTFVLSLAAAYVGRRFGDFFGRKLEVVGALVLIGLGVKMLVVR